MDLSYVVPVESTMEISQKIVALSEYMNFTMNEEMQRFFNRNVSNLSSFKIVFSTNLISEKNHENLVHFLRVSKYDFLILRVRYPISL